jgi:hypothetical protein
MAPFGCQEIQFLSKKKEKKKKNSNEKMEEKYESHFSLNGCLICND